MEYSLRKTKKIMLEYEILQMELEDSKSLDKEYEEAFLKEVFKYIEEYDIATPEEENNVTIDSDISPKGKESCKSEREAPSNSKNNLSDDIKKIYKKIVLKTHPDKNLSESDEIREKYRVVYEKTQNAATSSDYIEIIKIANDLGIEIPELGEDIIKKIKSNLEDIQESIDSYKNKYPWIWFNSEDSEKEIHIKEFLDANKNNIHNIMKYRGKA